MGTGPITAMAGACAVGGIAAVIAWLRGHPGRLDPSVAVVGLAGTGAIAVVCSLVVVVSGDRWAFPLVHLGYLVLAGAVPAVGAGTLVLIAWRRGRVLAAATSLALVVPAPVGWYASHVAPYRLRVDHQEVVLPAERAGSDPLRLGVLADIQATSVSGYERRAVRSLMAERPDVIVFAGDLFQGTDAQFDEQLDDFRSLLGELHAPGGVYAVRGDVDTGDRLDRAVEGTDVEILDDEIVTVEVGDRTVRVGGNPLRWAPPEGVALRSDLGASDRADIRILVAHRPDVVGGLQPSDDIDLTVAGHTHGGQVAIPGFGPPLTFTSVPRRVAAGGLHEVHGHRIYVSTGIGVVRLQAPQIRLFTRPSVGLVTFRSSRGG